MTHARIAVVGTGWWSSEAHLPAVAGHPDAQLVAVVDTGAERRERAVARFGPCDAHADVETLLAAHELDGAVVAAPNHLHHPLAATLLDAGVHVLVEKPLTIDPADARDLVARAAAAGVELLVGYTYHYHPQMRALREQIRAGRIGAVELASVLFASIVREMYRGTPDVYRQHLGDPATPPAAETYSHVVAGGQAQNQLTHAVALLLYLTGLAPAGVAGFLERRELGVDLVDALALRFEGGALATVGSTGGLTRPHDEVFDFRVFGHDGHVAFDLTAGTAAIHDADGIERLPQLDADDRYPLRAPAENLIDVVLGRAANESQPAVAVQAVDVLDALRRAHAEGRTIALPA